MRPSTPFSFSLLFLSWASIAHSQCTLNIPQNPLTAQGLATPYELTGCNQLDFANEGVFVEAAILDPATGKIDIYNPLVVNAGMTPVGSTSGGSTSGGSTSMRTTINSATPSVTAPSSTSSVNTSKGKKGGAVVSPAARAAATQGAGNFITPITPTLPANAVVALWFGSNAQTVTLTGDTATCVNGLGTSVFGQFAYCNAVAFFAAASTAIQSGLMIVPALGTGTSNQPCVSTRDFRIVDQDQSDNVDTTYLMIDNSTLAQNTPANSKANPNAEVLSNASDNALMSNFIDPALKCTPYSNPCITCPSGTSASLVADEIQAAMYQTNPAMVPLNDPMVLVDGQQSLQKVNLYRAGVNQTQAASDADASPMGYCQNYAQSGVFISTNEKLFSTQTSPAADQATNLFTFLAMRFSMSFGPVPGLACTQLLNVVNPVTLTTDGNGVVTAATINTQALQQILAGTTTTVSTSSSSNTPSGVRLVSVGATSTSSAPSGVRLASAAGATTSPCMHGQNAPTSTSSTTTSSPITSAGQVVPTMPSIVAGVVTPTTTCPCKQTPVAANGALTVTVTVTVTATPCPSLNGRAPVQDASPVVNRYLRGVPVREHSRMQRKNKRVLGW